MLVLHPESKTKEVTNCFLWHSLNFSASEMKSCHSLCDSKRPTKVVRVPVAPNNPVYYVKQHYKLCFIDTLSHHLIIRLYCYS